MQNGEIKNTSDTAQFRFYVPNVPRNKEVALYRPVSMESAALWGQFLPLTLTYEWQAKYKPWGRKRISSGSGRTPHYSSNASLSGSQCSGISPWGPPVTRLLPLGCQMMQRTCRTAAQLDWKGRQMLWWDGGCDKRIDRNLVHFPYISRTILHMQDTK